MFRDGNQVDCHILAAEANQPVIFYLPLNIQKVSFSDLVAMKSLQVNEMTANQTLNMPDQAMQEKNN